VKEYNVNVHRALLLIGSTLLFGIIFPKTMIAILLSTVIIVMILAKFNIIKLTFNIE